MRLLDKPNPYGFRKPVLEFLNPHSKNGQQYNATKTERYQNKTVSFRVPQGSISGPLLFIIFINNRILYAEDTVIKTTAKNSELTGRHQEAFDKNNKLVRKYKPTVNEDKTKNELSNKSSGKSDVKMNRITVELKQSFRYLSYQIDC